MYNVKRNCGKIILYSEREERTYIISETILKLIIEIDSKLDCNEIVTLDYLYNLGLYSNQYAFIKVLKHLTNLNVISTRNGQVTNLNIDKRNSLPSLNIESNFTEGELAPSVAYWIFTDACNLRCPHCCWENHYNKGEELTDEEISNIIVQLAKEGVFKLSFSGGEPLVKYNSLVNAIKVAKKNNINLICIATNGTLLTEERIDELFKLGVTEIQISIDSHIESVHDSNRGPGTFKKAVDACNYISKKYGKKHLSIGTALTTLNVESILDTIDYCSGC